MDPILPLPIRLPPHGTRGVLRALHGQLRDAILDGRLQPGLRLPATRTLATALGISRNTAIAAYDLLLSEGYLTGRRGAGTYVAEGKRRELPRFGMSVAGLHPFWQKPPPLLARSAARAGDADLRPGLPDKKLVPFRVWRRISARALRALSRTSAMYAEPEGRPPLREAIASHVSFTRAVSCRAEDIVVTAGAQQAFDLLARILVNPGRTVVAVEDPGYPPLRRAFAAAGAEVIGVPVDAEGLRVDRLPQNVRVIGVTPSHQFPLGTAMSARRRAELLEFARMRRAVIVEDDYDGEFRFGGAPVEALQTLDRAGVVFYVGTFSKSLFPALRIGFIVSPPWTRNALTAAKQIVDWHSPVLAQDTLAAFIAEGHLARHIRKMRRIYGERRARLLEAVGRHPDLLEALPASAGLHVAARLRAPVRASAVAEAAARAGLLVDPLSHYGVDGRRAPNGFALGYGAVPAETIEPAIRRLARLVREGSI